MLARLLLLTLLVLACSPAPQQPSPPPSRPSEPSLTLRSGDKVKTFTRSQLLAHPAIKTLSIPDESGYEDQQMSYRAIPMAALMEGLEVSAGSELGYQTLDGFSSGVQAALVMNQDPGRSLAYLAVEPPDQPWPRFEGRTYGAGPFYMIWVNPQLSEIGREEWPFQVTSFTVRPSTEALYPDLVPDRKNQPLYRGYKSFVQNCFPCHTLDGHGSGKLGPDLNVPMNPTEYFQPEVLRKLIRDPHSVRTWAGMKMTGFDEKELPDAELEELIGYLRSRKKR
ncbi:cytochrome c [bacterium CPR1]|nr:cytochrome c [bacterium CPR1]